MKRKSKWLSVLAALILLATMIPFGMLANAADHTIATLDDLKKIGSDPDYLLNGNYTLTGDITIKNENAWTPIGTAKHPFTGTLNGKNGTTQYTIKFDNVTASSGSNYSGIFGYVGSGATISNINIASGSKITIKDKYIKSGSFIAGCNAGMITNCSIAGSEITSSAAGCDSYHIGLIAGENTGTIQNCSVTGSKITLGAVSNDSYHIGSIAGENKGIIKQSYNTSDISLEIYPVLSAGMAVGGITGDNSGTISQTYNTGSIAVEAEQYLAYSAGTYVGGIAGINENAINNSYNTGNISSYSFYQYSFAGGIAGYNKSKSAGAIGFTYNAGFINGCYKGGIAGVNINDNTISNSYYLSGLTGSPQYSYKQGNSSSSTPVTTGGLTLDEMKDIVNFTTNFKNFDNTNIWKIDNAAAYKFPTLINVSHVEAADNTTNFAGGNGKLYNPYQVSSTTQLDKARNDLSSCYKLANDITFTDWDFNSQTVNQNNQYLNYIQALSTAVIVADFKSPDALPAINIDTDKQAPSLADLIQKNNVLPKYVLVNGSVYVPITDWTGTFTGGTPAEYTLTPEWKVPVGFSGTKPSLSLKVNVTKVQNPPTVTGSSAFEWATGYSATINLSSDDNLMSLSDWVASGRLPNIVKVRSGAAGSYTYAWKHINPSSWVGGTNTSGINTYGLTATTDDSTSISITVNVNKAQTTSISSYQDGQFYNSGLKWIPIGVNITSDNKYSSTVNAFKGAFDGNGKSIYNLQINADASDTTTDNDSDPQNAYAGLFAINKGIITNFTVDDDADAATLRASLSNNKGEVRELLTNTFGNGLTFNGVTNGFSGSSVNITASETAYAGMIAGYNKLGGQISTVSNKSEKGSIKTLADDKSYAGGITGINSGTLSSVVNFDSITSNSASVNAVAGGISGRNDFQISNAINTGNVIAGYGSTMSVNNLKAFNATNLSAGGITAWNAAGNISNSCNVGGVRTQITSASTTDSIYAGGLIGYAADTVANTIDSASVCWTPTAKYSVEYASDAKTGYAGLMTNTLSDIQNNKLGTAITNAYTGSTFLSFTLPTDYGTGEFANKSAAETYLSGITSDGTIYNSKSGTGLTTTTTPQSPGTSSGGCQLMKVNFTDGTDNATAEFITKNTSVTVSSISVTKPQTQTNYFTGQSNKTDGLVVTATYNDDSSSTLPLPSDAYTVSSPDMSKAVSNEDVTVTYKADTNKTVKYQINVYTPSTTTVASISLNTDNVEKVFPVNATFNKNDCAGLVVTATSKTGTPFTSKIDIDQCTVSTPDMSTPGDKTITVTYGGQSKDYTIHAYSSDITLDKDSLALKVTQTDNLNVTTDPDLGDNVKFTSNNTDVATVSEYGDITAKSEGKATITASYGGSTATCTVTVSRPSAPTTFTASVVSGTTNVALSWSQVAEATGYVIYRSTSSGSVGSAIKTITSNSTTTYTDTGLSGETTYYYTIYSYVGSNTDNNRSLASTKQSATTPVIQITAATGSGLAVNHENATLSGIRTGTSVSALQSGLNQTVIVKDQSGQQISSGAIGTGMTVCLSGGGDPLTIVVKGDTSGDGAISISDMLLVKRQLLNISNLTSVYSIAGDVDGNGSISISDFILIKSQLLGKTTIN